MYTHTEVRWHFLWLQSLEYLIIIENGYNCPQHYYTRKRVTRLLPKNLKREQIPKDIGYSSDTEISDEINSSPTHDLLSYPQFKYR